MIRVNRLFLALGVLASLALPGRAQDEIELSFSQSATQTPTRLTKENAIYVRPNIKAPLYLHARGPSAVGDPVTVQLYRVVGGQKEVLFATAEAKVTKDSQIVKGWKLAAVTPTPPELDHPLQMLVKPLQDGKELKTHRLNLTVQRPDEYLEVRSQTFDEAKQEISVTVATKGRGLIGDPCEVVLDLDNSPHPLLKRPIPRSSVRLIGELAREGDEVTLRAGKLVLVTPEGGSRRGPIYVKADGVSRAFVIETDLKGTGRLWPNKGLRLAIADHVPASDELKIGVEADNVPWTGVKLHVWLDKNDNKMPDRDEVQTFSSARQLGVQLPAPAEDGAVLLQTSARDWEATFRTRGLSSAIRAGAWLEELDPRTNRYTQTITTTRALGIDATPPENISFVKPAQPYTMNKPLVVTIRSEDVESDIKEVWIGVGAATDDPKWRKKAVEGSRVGRRNEWTATLELAPDFKGPVEVGVLVVNGAGLVARESFETAVVAEKPGGGPGAKKLGAVSVKVLEGELVQNGVEVILVDDKGKVVERGVTADGKAVFTDVPPGKYTVASRKTASNTQGLAPAVVVEGKTTPVEVKLFRK